MYKQLKNPNSGEINMVVRTDGNVQTYIPFDPANSDYQAFLAWCAEGNTPEPADEHE